VANESAKAFWRRDHGHNFVCQRWIEGQEAGNLRNNLDLLLGLFDFPDRIRSHDQRHRTITSTQALMLMNSPWSHDQATAIESRLGDKHGSDFVRSAYLALLNEEPDTVEIDMAEEFLVAYEATENCGEAATPSWSNPARVAFIHALLNSNGVIYVD